MTTHDIKIWPEFYNEIVLRKKEFELRVDDRPYAAGDTLRLRLYNPAAKTYLGPVAICRVGACFRKILGSLMDMSRCPSCLSVSSQRK